MELNNSFVDFSVNMLEAHLNQSPDAMGLMEHPEDLGAVRTGAHPGSAWQFRNVRRLLGLPGVTWGALAQSDFGTPYPKPTRLLGRVVNLHKIIYEGDPVFDSNGGYVSPLPRQTSGSPMALGRLPDGAFRSSKAWMAQAWRTERITNLPRATWAQ
jgi:hypothetical protein